MESLGIDWKIMLAQIVNFGILLYVLQRVLYKPLIKAIDERNKKINNAVADSKKISDELAKIEEKQAILLKDARGKAREEREELIKIAERDKAKILEDAKSSAQKEISKGIGRIEIAKEEAIKEISDTYLKDITEKLYKRFSITSKKKNYPVLKSVLEDYGK